MTFHLCEVIFLKVYSEDKMEHSDYNVLHGFKPPGLNLGLTAR